MPDAAGSEIVNGVTPEKDYALGSSANSMPKSLSRSFVETGPIIHVAIGNN